MFPANRVAEMELLIYSGLAIYLLHPIILSLILYVFIGTFLWSMNSRFRYGRFKRLWHWSLGVVALCLSVAVAVDSAFAFRRVFFGKRMSEKPVALTTVPTPSSLVLVNGWCRAECLERLVAGVHSEIIFATTRRYEKNTPVDLEPPYPAMRFRITREAPGECPTDNQRELEKQWLTEPVLALQARGICPVIEPAVLPQHGIFIVNESMRVGVKEPAVEMKIKLLATVPPGPVSYFNVTEVQQRSADGIKVLGRVEAYEAAGFLGFPFLVGCWARPDNIAWIMPPGEPGCGLWRTITSGGNTSGGFHEGEWVYEKVFQGR